LCRLLADIVAKVFLAFGREILIQDRARTSNNDSKQSTLRFDCYKFLFHRACLATFATQSALSGHSEASARLSAFGAKRTCMGVWLPLPRPRMTTKRQRPN